MIRIFILLLFTLGVKALNATNPVLLVVPEFEMKNNPLEKIGDSVEIELTVTIPAKYFHKKMEGTFTPSLGNVKFKSIRLQGEKVDGNASVISYQAGGTIHYVDKVKYHQSMANAPVMIESKITKGSKTMDTYPFEIGMGTLLTIDLLEDDFMPMIARDNFVRVEEKQRNGIIYFEPGNAKINSTKTETDQHAVFKQWLSCMIDDEWMEVSEIEIIAYSTAFGNETAMNTEKLEKMAKERAKATEQYLKKVFKEYHITKKIKVISKPRMADMELLKRAINEANLPDKDLIIRVLAMYGNDERGLEEIKKLANTYEIFEKEIFPDLHRSEIRVYYHQTYPKYIVPDHQYWIRTKPDMLEKEEFLMLANFFETTETRINGLRMMARYYPEDWRVWNNLGANLLMEGNLTEGTEYINKAILMQENDVTHNNMGVIYALNKDNKMAINYFNKCKVQSEETNHNLGIIAAKNGDYAGALEKLKLHSYNQALITTLFLGGDIAASILDEVMEMKTANHFYLRAVIGAREKDEAALFSSLEKSIEIDPSVKKRAATDLEFRFYFENDRFKKMVNE